MDKAVGKRREPRRGYRGVVRVTRQLGEEGTPLRALDLSPGGCFVVTDEPFELEEVLVVTFEVEGLGPLTAFARVAHRRSPEAGHEGIGLAFLDLSPSDESSLRQACQSLPPMVPKAPKTAPRSARAPAARSRRG